MEIISNTDYKSNHRMEFIDLFNCSSEIVCASPFLMVEFSNFFKNIENYPKTLRLITTLKPNDREQIDKIKGLRNLFLMSRRYSIDLHVYFDENLHGKVYIGKNPGEGTSTVILTSANFTENGIEYNHEWGVKIKNEPFIQSIEEKLFKDVGFDELTEDTLKEMEERVDTFMQGIGKTVQQESNKIPLNLSTYLNRFPPSFINGEPTFWIKPIGVSDNPVQEDWDFSTDSPQYFAKKPIGVKMGDILICYGVGIRKILSIYKVKGKLQRATSAEIDKEQWKERWPWYFLCENLTCRYGKDWAKHNLMIGGLVQKFQKEFPHKNVTLKNKGLGGLNRGCDKIKLNPDFAHFVIENVLETER